MAWGTYVTGSFFFILALTTTSAAHAASFQYNPDWDGRDDNEKICQTRGDSLLCKTGVETYNDVRPHVADATYSVSPELPCGLSLGPTGVILGTPVTSSPPTEYTITRLSQGRHVDTVTLTIAVTADEKLGALPVIRYHEACDAPAEQPVLLIEGKQNSILPTISGSRYRYCQFTHKSGVAAYLPEGLKFCTGNHIPAGVAYDKRWVTWGNGCVEGEFTGTVPEGPRGNTSGFRVSCTLGAPNKSGPARNVQFRLVKEPSFVYPGPSLFFQLNKKPLAVVDHVSAYWPQITGHDHKYSVSPELPEGVQLDTETGKVWGTPSKLFPPTSYTFRATSEDETLETTQSLYGLYFLPTHRIEFPELWTLRRGGTFKLDDTGDLRIVAKTKGSFTTVNDFLVKDVKIAGPVYANGVHAPGFVLRAIGDKAYVGRISGWKLQIVKITGVNAKGVAVETVLQQKVIPQRYRRMEYKNLAFSAFGNKLKLVIDQDPEQTVEFEDGEINGDGLIGLSANVGIFSLGIRVTQEND